MSRVSIRIRAALITTIYRKSLSLSNSFRQKYTTGEVVNFMSTGLKTKNTERKKEMNERIENKQT